MIFLFWLHYSEILVPNLLFILPFPRFSPVPHLGAEPVGQHQHTVPGPNLPLSLSLPVLARLRLELRLRPAPISFPHQHIYCTCLLAPCHPHTQFPFIYPANLADGAKKRDNERLKCREKDYSCWGQACLTFTENTHCYPVYSTAHSGCWLPCTSPSTGFFEGHRLCGGSSKHIFIQLH